MPVLTAQNPIYGNNYLDSLLGALSTRPASSLLDAPIVKLFKAGPLPIRPTSSVAEFTDCDFTGYAAAPLTLSSPLNLPTGDGRAELGNVNWVATNGIAPNTALGYYVDDGAGQFVCGEYFDVPVAFANGGDFLDLAVFLAFANTVLTGA